MNVQPIHFVSYSSLNLFHSCPRKFELDRNGPEKPNFENINFTYGHSLGAGIAYLFEHGDLARAKYAAFLAWDMDLYSGFDPIFEPGSGYKEKNSFPQVLEALDKFYGHYLVMASEW